MFSAFLWLHQDNSMQNKSVSRFFVCVRQKRQKNSGSFLVHDFLGFWCRLGWSHLPQLGWVFLCYCSQVDQQCSMFIQGFQGFPETAKLLWFGERCIWLWMARFYGWFPTFWFFKIKTKIKIQKAETFHGNYFWFEAFFLCQAKLTEKIISYSQHGV